MKQASSVHVTQAGLTSLVVAIVGQLVAFIPSLAVSQEILVSAGSTAIAAGYLIANAIHSVADAKRGL